MLFIQFLPWSIYGKVKELPALLRFIFAVAVAGVGVLLISYAAFYVSQFGFFLVRLGS